MSEAPPPQTTKVHVEHYDKTPKDQNRKLVATIAKVVFAVAVALRNWLRPLPRWSSSWQSL